MKLRTWAPYAALLAAVMVLGIEAKSGRAGESVVPSVDNRGPFGIGVLWTYLRESGFAASSLDHSLESIPKDAATVVAMAPAQRELTDEEVVALRRFVERGGTFVFSPPPDQTTAQLALRKWLRWEQSGRLTGPTLPRGTEDPLGIPAEVWRPLGPLAAVHELRIERGPGLGSEDPEMLPAAGTSGATAVLTKAEGRGRIWVLSNPSLAENRRLELSDNLAFWTALAARGPIAFDEFHHVPEGAGPAGSALALLGLQLVLCTAAMIAARGSRLGPPREPKLSIHRASAEYVRAFAWLTRRAGVEAELLAELHGRLRTLLHERANIRIGLSDEDAARELELQRGISRDAYLSVSGALLPQTPSVTPRQYAKALRAYAQMEARLRGQARPPRAT